MLKDEKYTTKTKPALCDLAQSDIAHMREQIRRHRKHNTNPHLIKYCIDLFDTSHPDFKR